jgi:VWFA-related protein
MRNVPRLVSSGIALALAAGGLRQAIALAQTPAFPTEVDIVTVDAAALDASGRPVIGLGKEDFVVEEDGQKQEIVSFEAVTAASDAGAVAEPPAIATNAEGKPGRAFAIVVDDLRLPGEQSQDVRQAVERFLDASLGPGDTVAVATTSGDGSWTARLPEGRDDLRAVLARLKGRYVDPGPRDGMSEYEAYWITHHEAGPPPRLTTDEARAGVVANTASVFARVAVRYWSQARCGRQGSRPDIDSCLPIVRAVAGDLDGARRQRVAASLHVLERALLALAPMHGRTALLFLSPGFLQDDEQTTRDVASAALRAHTAVYFIDVRGLTTGLPSAAAAAEPVAQKSPGGETQKRFEQSVLEAEGAVTLAEDTGGFSVRNGNDLAASAARIAAESRTFYLLGFHPPAGKPDAWRKLRVTVRRDGVTVRARRGYTRAGATQAPIPLRLASYVLETMADGKTRVVAVAEIDTAGAATDLQMRLEAVPLAGGQTQVQDVSLKSSGAATASSWKAARLGLALPAGVHEVRVSVRDPASGRHGAASQRVVVAEPGTFRLSTLLYTDRGVPVAHAAFAPQPDRPLLATFEVFGAGRDPATGQPSLESQFVLKDDEGRPLGTPPPSPLLPSAEGRLQQVIALPPLPGGGYELAVSIRDRVTGNEVEAHRPFTIDAPRGAAAAREDKEPSRPESPELAALLDEAARYVLAYGHELSNVVADEESRQVLRSDDPTKRILRNIKAGAFFVTLPGPVPWATFRDVWEVDGSKILDRSERLARLFRDSPGTAARSAKAILEESARFNIGPPSTVNIPTLALVFLHPDNQRRFEFELKARSSVQGTSAVEVAFHERTRPALIQGGTTAEGAPARGRFWIDPDRGAVLRTDVTYDTDVLDDEHRSEARVVTEYRQEAALGILVPSAMKETYRWPPVEGPRFQDFRNPQKESIVITLEAETKYSGYRRFEVTTEEGGAREAPKPR